MNDWLINLKNDWLIDWMIAWLLGWLEGCQVAKSISLLKTKSWIAEWEW